MVGAFGRDGNSVWGIDDRQERRRTRLETSAGWLLFVGLAAFGAALPLLQ